MNIIMLAKHLKWNKDDDWNTPIEAWQTILNYIPKETNIMLPFYNDGTALDMLNNLGYHNIEHKDVDFFKLDLSASSHLVIDNPPYSIKKKVIEKLKKNGKPFALLLPLHTLEREYLWGDSALQIIIKKGKFKFLKKQQVSTPYKACWFCWNFHQFLGDDSQLIFVE